MVLCVESFCGERFWAASAVKVKFIGMVCGGASMMLLRDTCHDCVERAKPWRAVRSALQAKALVGILASRDDDDTLVVAFSHCAHHLGATPLLHEVL